MLAIQRWYPVLLIADLVYKELIESCELRCFLRIVVLELQSIFQNSD